MKSKKFITSKWVALIDFLIVYPAVLSVWCYRFNIEFTLLSVIGVIAVFSFNIVCWVLDARNEIIEHIDDIKG